MSYRVVFYMSSRAIVSSIFHLWMSNFY